MKAFIVLILSVLPCTVALAYDPTADLREQRHKILVQHVGAAVRLADSAQKSFDAGKLELKDVIKAYKDLVDVRMEIASTPKLRVTALELHVDALAEIEAKYKKAEDLGTKRHWPGRHIPSEAYQQIQFASQTAQLELLEEEIRNASTKLTDAETFNELIKSKIVLGGVTPRIIPDPDDAD